MPKTPKTPTAAAASSAGDGPQTRACEVCAKPVEDEERVIVLRSSGEQWRHAYHGLAPAGG